MSRAESNPYRPVLFRPGNGDAEAFRRLLSLLPAPAVLDTLAKQLEGLIQSRHPREKFDANELRALALAHAGKEPRDHGVWVYYPWRHTVAHLLDEAEFVELRTARNRYKITAEEQAALAEQRCGIVGLSVGSAIALTIATERLCGELRLADHDHLELSNLNRLQGSVLHLGLPKVVLAARAIAELDPFLRVSCFEQGITEGNLDEFLVGSGKLHVLIEECDDLTIKLACRQKARAAGIAVVMEANDRATLDIERYDLEPGRPILHGFLNDVDFSRAAELKTSEQKIPILMPMVGAKTMSSKLAASLLEVGESLDSWPQLGSDVSLGAAVVAHVVRRIALGELRSSGRYFVDLEQIITDAPEQGRAADPPQSVPASAVQETVAERATTKRREPADPPDALTLPAETLRALVSAATLAPSGGNQQPWSFEARRASLSLRLDRRRTGSLLDFGDAAALVGLGAASENLVLEAQRRELGVELAAFPAPDDLDLVGRFRFYRSNTARPVEGREFVDLAAHIGERHTNRRIVTREALPERSFDDFRGCVGPAASLLWFTEPEALLALGRVMARAERIRMLHEQGHRDFVLELKESSLEAERDRDGIDPATLDLTAGERAGLALLRNGAVAGHLRAWNQGRGLEKLTRKSFTAASAVGILVVPEFGRRACFEAGRVAERIWLTAQARGIALQPHTAGLFLFLRLLRGAGEGLSKADCAELRELHSEFQRLTGFEGHALFLFRLFPGCQAPARSLRRNFDDVFSVRE